MDFERKSNMDNNIPDFINRLEIECRGLEKLFCRNAIGNITNKIDSIEKKLNMDFKKKNFDKNVNSKLETEQKRLDDLSRNIDVLKTGFDSRSSSSGISSSDLIFKTIEENYKLLDELERTNRPIFSIKTEANNKVYVEDKIREMDSRLGTLFTAYRERCKSAGITSDSDIHQKYNEFSRDLSKLNSDSQESNSNPVTKTENTKEIRLKELHEKLVDTENKIKKLAGTILKNF